MGGCTITRLAEGLTPLFADIKEQIIGAARAGLYPDSELIVIDPSEEEARIFKVNVEYEDTQNHWIPTGVEFEEVKRGRAFHVGVAGHYGPKPEAGQLVGTVHVHS